MRGYAWWVPMAERLEEKVTAAQLVYRHSQNADDLVRLMNFLSVPIAGQVFRRRDSRRCIPFQSQDSFRAVCRWHGRRGSHSQLEQIKRILSSSTAMHDFYIVEVLQEIVARYEKGVIPLLHSTSQHLILLP